MITLLKLFFGFIIAALLVALFIVIALVTGVVSLFHKAKSPKQSTSGTYSNSTSDAYGQSNSGYQQPTGGQPKKKIIPQDEGEYVDFEEVK